MRNTACNETKRVIDYWRQADLTDALVPADLTQLASELSAWEAGFVAGNLKELALSRAEYEHRHGFWQHRTTSHSLDSVYETTIAGRKGDPIRCRRYCPSGEQLATLYFLHGGGWVFGSLESHDRFCQVLAEGTGFVVSAIDYPRAPEASCEDILERLHDVLLSEMNKSESACFLAGDSAGATLALALALQGDLSDALDGLALFYGAFDPSLSLRSHYLLDGTARLTRSRMRWYWQQFLQSGQELELLDHKKITGLPPALLVCGSRDLLLDDTLTLASNMCGRTESVDLLIEPGMPHGFLQMSDHVGASADAMQCVFHWAQSQARRGRGAQ